MSAVEQVEARLADLFSAEPDVRLAYLFGSVARGEEGPLSDIDVAVLLDAPSDEQGSRADRLRGRLAGALRRDDVDLIPLHLASPLLKHRIVRDGRLLYARDRREAGRFAARTVLEYLDTAPLRRAAQEAMARRLEAGLFGRRIPYKTVRP